MDHSPTQTGRSDRGDGVELAWSWRAGQPPIVVFLPGYRSDMQGAKATEVAALCEECGFACLLLDYSGHGASGGNFTDGTIGRWTNDVLHLLDRLTSGPVILAGSSMGAWIALLVAILRPERVTALVGIAAAPDFTERLMWDAMTPAERETLMESGVLMAPSAYGDPLPVTRALIEDGRDYLLLDAPIPVTCQVRLLHGQMDPDVPWETSLALSGKLESADVQLTLVKDGDHRLSRPSDLALLRSVIADLLP